MKTLEEVKKEILELLKSVKRDGIEKLICFLEESDYFKAPASSKYHGTIEGGLARHSLLTYNILKEKVNLFGLDISQETQIICGLCHDLCKVNYYKVGIPSYKLASASQISYLKNLVERSNNNWSQFVDKQISKEYASKLIDYFSGKTNEIPIQETEWVIEDTLPLGHGEKSLYMLMKFINLKNEEATAIRWHMSFSDPAVHFKFPAGRSYEEAMKKSPLVILLFTSDFEARMYDDISNIQK